MSASELEAWRVFEAQEPFMPFRLELGFGLLCSVLANINKRKNVRGFVPTDFMPLYEAEMKREEEVARRAEVGMPPPEDLEDAQMQRLVLAFGGTVVR